METYNRVIEVIDVNIIYCLGPFILSLMLFKLLFRNKLETKKALNIVRWFIIAYTTVTLIHFIIGLAVSPENFAFTDRATGPYWVAYWLMLLSATVLPYTLLVKKLATKFLYVLFVAIFIKIGFYFERFVILVSGFHSDFSPGENGNWQIFPVMIGMLFLQGLILAIITLGIIEVTARIKSLAASPKQKENLERSNHGRT